MANEIRGAVQLQVVNGNFEFAYSENLAFDQNTAGGGNPDTVEIGASEEVVNFGDITTEGWCIMKNLDTIDYVDYGPESGGSMVPMGRMNPGEPACFRFYPGLTLRMQAAPFTGTATATALVYIAIMED